MKRSFFSAFLPLIFVAATANANWIVPNNNCPQTNYCEITYPSNNCNPEQVVAQPTYYQEQDQVQYNSLGQPVCMPVIDSSCQPSYQPSPCTTPCQPTFCQPDCNPCYDSCNWSNNCGGVWGFYAQFLWLGVYGEQLDYGAYVLGDPTTDPVFVHNSEILEHQFNWRPGVRLGAFYQSPCGGPDVTFEWFYYRNNHSVTNEFLAPGDLTFFEVNSVYLYEPSPSFIVGDGELDSLTLNSQLNFRINHFLIKYGSYINWSESLSFHPYAGPVFYQTNQDISVTMATISTDPVIASQAQTTDVYTQLRAGGVKVGADMSYEFYNEFSFIADLGVTGAAGYYTLNRNFSSILSDDGITVDVFTDSIGKWTARAIIDLSFGFRYCTCFCGGYLAFAQIEWEYHHLFDQTAFLLKDMSIGPALIDGNGLKGFTRSNADLIIHGLCVSAGVAF